MRVKAIPESWSAPVTLTADEIWQAVTGAVLVTVEASPAVEDGIRLDLYGGLRIAAGTTVRYRRTGGADAELAREALG